MSHVGELGLGEVGVEASNGLRDILTRVVAGELVTKYVDEDPLSWDVIRNGGWDLLGVSEADDGAGASLRDLVEIARVWGWSIVPLPLMTSIMAKRWSFAAREHDGPVSFAVRTRSSAQKGVVPFAEETDIRLLSGTLKDSPILTLSSITPDSYAPSLRLGECDGDTAWSREAANELRVMWAAEASGCAVRMLDDAITYVKQREQFGQPIGCFQAVKHHLANAHLLSEQAETAVILASIDPDRAAAASKFAFDASLKTIEIAVQAHGGLGFTWEMGLHLYMRHVSALRDLAAGLPL